MLIQPDLRPVKESGDIYELRDKYPFELNGQVFYIPAGFRSDGATGARLLFQRDGRHRAAALVHDYLYVHQGKIEGYTVDRKTVDLLFKEMLRDAGIKSWHVAASYIVIRALGWIWWSRN